MESSAEEVSTSKASSIKSGSVRIPIEDLEKDGSGILNVLKEAVQRHKTDEETPASNPSRPKTKWKYTYERTARRTRSSSPDKILAQTYKILDLDLDNKWCYLSWSEENGQKGFVVFL